MKKPSRRFSIVIRRNFIMSPRESWAKLQTPRKSFKMSSGRLFARPTVFAAVLNFRRGCTGLRLTRLSAKFAGARRTKKSNMRNTYPSFRKTATIRCGPWSIGRDTLDEKYAERELQQLLNEALDQLKPVDKSAVVLSDMEGMSDKEIAVMLGLTVSAVKTRLHRARLFLRGKLAVHLGYSAA